MTLMTMNRRTSLKAERRPRTPLTVARSCSHYHPLSGYLLYVGSVYPASDTAFQADVFGVAGLRLEEPAEHANDLRFISDGFSHPLALLTFYPQGLSVVMRNASPSLR